MASTSLNDASNCSQGSAVEVVRFLWVNKIISKLFIISSPFLNKGNDFYKDVLLVEKFLWKCSMIYAEVVVKGFLIILRKSSGLDSLEAADPVSC